MKFLIKFILFAFILVVIANIIPGIEVDGFLSAFFAAVVIGFVNTFIRPIILILTIPVNLITIGLFTFIINALMFMAAAYIVPGFNVESFLAALFGSIILSFCNLFIGLLFKDYKIY